jgi:hypothetical protein
VEVNGARCRYREGWAVRGGQRVADGGEQGCGICRLLLGSGAVAPALACT